MIRFSAVFFAALLASGFTAAAVAGDLEWSGAYRIEGNTFHNLMLKTGEKKRKEYGVHQLILRPKIVAADGLYINSQINLQSDSTIGAGNQLGVVFGDGFDTPTATAANSSNSAALSENEQDELLSLSQFYLTHVQEFGSLIVGRAPVQFGLGMTHNAGRGAFDHYMDTRDLLGYKVVMGNFYFLPMLGKVKEGGLAGYDDVNDVMLQLQYENPDSDTEMGLMYWNRKSHLVGNDAQNPTGGPFGGTATGDFDYKLMSIFYSRKIDAFNIGFEIANQTGDTGAAATAGDIKFGGMGIAFEMGYQPQDKKYSYGLKGGWATGDDPSTKDEYEGFVFDRNYDVAMMMFNHGLGQGNFLHTQVNGTKFGASNQNTPNTQPDVEAISNVMYFSPYLHYKWSDKWSLDTTVTTGWLDQTKLTATSKDSDNGLGYEFDFSFNFSPNERVVWQNSFGWLVPGSAFEGDSSNSFNTSAAYGFVSRAAISF